MARFVLKQIVSLQQSYILINYGAFSSIIYDSTPHRHGSLHR